MKNLATVLSVIALIGVIILGVMINKNSSHSTPARPAVTAGDKSGATANVAYIDIDTFEANYTVLKDKKEELKKRQDAMEAELSRSEQQIQRDIQALQSKAGTMSQAEGQAAEKRINQMAQSFKARKQTMEDQFIKDQASFNENLRHQLDSFLEEYNAEHRYDYILSYSKSNPQIMYVNKNLNITADVIKGMNERAATTKAK